VCGKAQLATNRHLCQRKNEGGLEKVLANLWSRQKIAKKPHASRGQETIWEIPVNGSMALEFPDAGKTGATTPFKYTKIRNPSNKIMFVEEPSNLTSTECPAPGIATESAGTFLDDGRWDPSPDDNPFAHNLISVRHHPSGPNAGSNITFADGHAQITWWGAGTNDMYVSATY